MNNDKKETTLKPCCCGGKAAIHTDDSIGNNINHFVYCTKCDIATNSMCSLEDAINIWNTRTETPKDREIERLRGALEMIALKQGPFLNQPDVIESNAMREIAKQAIADQGEKPANL